MLNIDTKNLQSKKNLLAFSAGIDSSALFFLLIENNIRFDITIVDYNIREQSKKELAHAKALAKEHKLFCHTIQAPMFDTHFESKARKFRYEFFESLIQTEGYDNLITAHQLNDQLEWLLMRLTKGAGVSELIGLKPVTYRENYTLVRPLLEYSKDELLTYLKENNHPYFIDESNIDVKYERNLFRKQFSDPLMANYKEGIKRSFDYLRKDKKSLEKDFETIFTEKKLKIIKLHTISAKIKAADLALKESGYLLSASQRQEIKKERSLVIGGKWALELKGHMLYIAPYLNNKMPKSFKEMCRLAKIPAKIRPYCFHQNIDVTHIQTVDS
ncbi:tRNA(Ile)-lysidine synthetase [Sulfurovum lithotrophicum]|uniref:tRNA(Ile)-lysidine synthase n=1 Tax=Sulfurovum lithotrophicum TaxID=206403 RepID=A0A7U4LZK7_9BACT|nr:tRNA lysidine(34) synthetase TilS [Sulfurovum lithotrophicum]AKF24079.1 tRNA(Ile)-lysidine synthetase [Sulfurovum lithotrophicum]